MPVTCTGTVSVAGKTRCVGGAGFGVAAGGPACRFARRPALTTLGQS